jgi:hypothetical protein
LKRSYISKNLTECDFLTKNDELEAYETYKEFEYTEMSKLQGYWDRKKWVVANEEKKKIRRGKIHPLPMQLYKTAVWTYIYGLYRGTQMCVPAGLEGLFFNLLKIDKSKSTKLAKLTKLAFEEEWITEDTKRRIDTLRKDVRNVLMHGKIPYHDDPPPHQVTIFGSLVNSNTGKVISRSITPPNDGKEDPRWLSVSARDAVELFQDVIVDVFNKINAERNK